MTKVNTDRNHKCLSKGNFKRSVMIMLAEEDSTNIWSCIKFINITINTDIRHWLAFISTKRPLLAKMVVMPPAALVSFPTGPMTPTASWCLQWWWVCYFRVTRHSQYKKVRVLYQQDGVDAAVVLWIIRHLSIFTWKATAANESQYHFFCNNLSRLSQIVALWQKTISRFSPVIYFPSPQITFPPCVTKPSSLTLTSTTVPLVMTPREV